MCEPIAFAAVMAIAQTALQSKAGRAQAEKAEKFRQNKERLERIQARREEGVRVAEIHAQQATDDRIASDEMNANRRQAADAIGTATTIAGERGAFGLSYEALVSDFLLQQSEYETGIEANLAVRNQFAELNIQAAKLGTQARFINAATMPISQPNYMNYAVQGLGTFFSIYSATTTPGGGGRPAGMQGALRADGSW